MYTITKIKHIAFILGLSYFLFLSVVSHAQAGAGASTITSQNSNGFSIGFYGGPNVTSVTSIWGISSAPNAHNIATCSAGVGSDYTLLATLKLPKGLFFSTGLSYEIQAYKISGINLMDVTPEIYAPYNIIFGGGNTEYDFTTYNISLPLIPGYRITKKKWSFSFGLGIEFYYNIQDKEIVYNGYHIPSPTQGYFYSGHILSTSDYGIFNNYYWSVMGAMGILQAGVNYKISPKFSISCMPVLRFTNPFLQNPLGESFIQNVRQNTFSLSLGINYHFSNKYLAGDYQSSDDKPKKFSLGFSIIPNDLVNKILLPLGEVIDPKSNNRFSFSYAFPIQYDITHHVALESGIAIDNFNYLSFTNNTLIGLPIIVKYYFPLGDASSLYIGAGCHFDYPTNLGWLYDPAHPYILPLALGKVGYRCIVGKNYYFDVNIGYEVSLNNTQSLQGDFVYAYAEPEITGLPRYVFSSVGFGCRF